MGKERISATVNEGTNSLINSILKKRKFRNKSHIIEEAIRRLWEEENDKNKK